MIIVLVCIIGRLCVALLKETAIIKIFFKRIDQNIILANPLQALYYTDVQKNESKNTGEKKYFLTASLK